MRPEPVAPLGTRGRGNPVVTKKRVAHAERAAIFARKSRHGQAERMPTVCRDTCLATEIRRVHCLRWSGFRGSSLRGSSLLRRDFVALRRECLCDKHTRDTRE
jgi:hypothetical protein